MRPLAFGMSVTTLCVLASLTAFAQSSTGSGVNDAILDTVKKAGTDILTRQAEEFAGRVFTPEQIDLIKDVLSTATGADTRREPTNDSYDHRAPDRDEGSLNSGLEKLERDSKAGREKGKGWGQGRGKGNRKGLPPGLAKKKTLPPGLQKRLDRGDGLPPGLAKRQLPEDLDRQLGPPAPETERAIIGDDVVLLERATGVVLDVIHDVIRARDY